MNRRTLTIGEAALAESTLALLPDPIDHQHRPGSAEAELGFTGRTAEECEARRLVLTAAARGEVRLPDGDLAQAVLDDIAAADAVLLAGVLDDATSPARSSTTAVVAATADARGVPLLLAVSASPPPGERVAAALASARWIAAGSQEWTERAVALGAAPERIWRPGAADWAVGDEPSPHLGAGLEEGFLAASLDGLAVCGADRLAAQLTELARLTDRTVVVLPGRDAALAEKIAATGDRLRSCPTATRAEVAWLIGQSTLLISGDPSTTALGLRRAVPVVAVADDAAGERALVAELELVGLADWVVSALGLDNGVLAAAAAEAWERRADLRGHLVDAGPAQVTRRQGVSTALQAVLDRTPPPAADPVSVSIVAASGHWTERNSDALACARMTATRIESALQERDTVQRELTRTVLELSHARSALRDALDDRRALLENLAVERAADEAAKWDNAVLLEEILELRRARSAARRGGLDDVIGRLRRLRPTPPQTDR